MATRRTAVFFLPIILVADIENKYHNQRRMRKLSFWKILIFIVVIYLVILIVIMCNEFVAQEEQDDLIRANIFREWRGHSHFMEKTGGADVEDNH